MRKPKRPPTKIDKINRASDLLRKSSTLTQMHTTSGLAWFLVPGGEVTARVAIALIERPEVQPNHDGWFPGISQTYTLSARACESLRQKQRREKELNMDMSQYCGSNFLKLDDVRDHPRQETIAACEPGNYDKPDLIFKSGDVLSLNKTSIRTLIKHYGENSDDWENCVVELYVDQVDFEKGKTDAVLVRPITPAKANGTLPRPKKKEVNDSMDDEIY